MADPRELRKKRLENEYKELMRINGAVIRIEPLENAPYSKYGITYNIRTIISPSPTYRDTTVVTLTIPPSYPGPTGAPTIIAENTPSPWHPNWWPDGRWCSAYYSSNYDSSESLVNLVLRCARVLQFDPVVTNTGSPANSAAIAFWDANARNKRVIPCDTKPLPVPGAFESITIVEKVKPKITINQTQVDKPKITILPRNDE